MSTRAFSLVSCLNLPYSLDTDQTLMHTENYNRLTHTHTHANQAHLPEDQRARHIRLQQQHTKTVLLNYSCHCCGLGQTALTNNGWPRLFGG